MSKTKTILLWVAVPFAAVVAMSVGYVMGKVIQTLCLNMVLIGAEGLKVAISNIIGELIAGAAFVAAGTAVAPTKKKTVSIVLATIITSFCVTSVIYYYILGYELTLLKVTYILAMSVGAIVCACGYKDTAI